MKAETIVPAVDLYEVLQVAPSADPEVVLAAYRTLARKHHPDAGGDGRVMASLNAAWHILGRPDLRHAYDLERVRTIARARRRESSPAAAGDTVPSQARRPPPGTGTVIDFGRYAGWSIGSLAEADPDYLEWLARTPIGRSLMREIEAALAARAQAAELLRPHGDQRSGQRAAHGWFAR